MSKITENLVVENFDLRLVTGSDSSFSVGANMMVLFDSCKILLSLNGDSVLQVFFHPIIPDASIRPESIFGENMNSVFFIFLNFVHENVWVSRDGLDAHLALAYIAQLDLGFVTSLDFDSRAINVSDIASQDLRLGIHTLEVKSDERAGKKVTILYHHTIVPFRDYVHGSLLEVGETTIRHLDITVDGNGS